jgi:predicted enzyme related to lactoylglutathione lyase
MEAPVSKIPGITGLAQVALSVTDLERSMAFYRDVLGLPLLFTAPPGLAFLQCGQTRMMLSTQDGDSSGSHPILYYGVPDIHAAVSAVEARGAVIKEPAKMIARLGTTEVWLAFTVDPDGHMVGLMSELPAAT